MQKNIVSLIAIIIAAVTAMSMVLKSLVLVIEKNKMNFWYIDYNLNVSISSGDQLYYVAISIILSIVMSLLYIWIMSTNAVYIFC